MTPELLKASCPADHSKSSPPQPCAVFVPVVSPPVAEACSISCQTDEAHMESSSTEPTTPTKSKEDRRKSRLERSHSMRGKKKEQGEAFTRTSSFRASHETGKAIVQDISKKADSLERESRDKGGEYIFCFIQVIYCNISLCAELNRWRWRLGVSAAWTILTHWGRGNIAAIFQTIFSYAFSWIKMNDILIIFHWSLFLKVPINNIPALV